MTTSIEEALRSGAVRLEEFKLVKRPVAFRVKAPADTGWQHLYYRDEQNAAEAAEQIGVDYEGLYVRDGTPLVSPDTAALVALIEERDRFRAALTKIDAIRNSIIGFQNVGWSDHIYPLVAALHEAGFEGQGYKEASTEIRTMLAAERQAEAAEARALAAEAECDALREALRLLVNHPSNYEVQARARALTQETSNGE